MNGQVKVCAGLSKSDALYDYSARLPTRRDEAAFATGVPNGLCEALHSHSLMHLLLEQRPMQFKDGKPL